MKISDKRGKQSGKIADLISGTVIFYENKYLLITDSPDLCVDLFTGALLELPIEVFDSQILNNVKLVVK